MLFMCVLVGAVVVRALRGLRLWGALAEGVVFKECWAVVVSLLIILYFVCINTLFLAFLLIFQFLFYLVSI